jgi:hypothetical protein
MRPVIVRNAGRVVITRWHSRPLRQPFDYGQPWPIALNGILMTVS